MVFSQAKKKKVINWISKFHSTSSQNSPTPMAQFPKHPSNSASNPQSSTKIPTLSHELSRKPAKGRKLTQSTRRRGSWAHLNGLGLGKHGLHKRPGSQPGSHKPEHGSAAALSHGFSLSWQLLSPDRGKTRSNRCNPVRTGPRKAARAAELEASFENSLG